MVRTIRTQPPSRRPHRMKHQNNEEVVLRFEVQTLEGCHQRLCVIIWKRDWLEAGNRCSFDRCESAPGKAILPVFRLGFGVSANRERDFLEFRSFPVLIPLNRPYLTLATLRGSILHLCSSPRRFRVRRRLIAQCGINWIFAATCSHQPLSVKQMMKQNLIVLLVMLTATPALAEQDAPDKISPEQLKFFETKIRPVLIKECYGCHSNKSGNVRGGLRLDTRELTLLGGSSGPAIVPGEPDESFLYTAMTHEDFVMPPKRKLSQEIINDFREWIEMGAPDPRVTKVAEIQSTISEEDIQEAKESFWAYQKPVHSKPPATENADWAKTDIDRYVLARLEQAQLPAPEDAEPYKVLRRLCFDFVGLPPNPEQVRFFTKMWKEQGADRAITLVVDRLLEKDQYGERWGRHWLDVARFGESTGREVNMTFPHAWRYRDYVIDSFNEDKPFDRFIEEQIAGDLLPVKSDGQWAKNLVATGFLAMGSKNLNEQNRVQFAADLADEQIDTTTRVFLGMSVACARCHDHKFDAIPQTDYYAMAGIFNSTITYFGNPPSEYGNFTGVQARRSSSLLVLPVDDPNPYDKKYSAKELADLKKEMQDTLADAVQARRNLQAGGGTSPQAAQRQRLRTANELSVLSAKLAVVDDQGNPRSYCMGVQDHDQARDARVLARGEIDQAGQSVRRGFPRVLSDGDVQIKKGSGRLELARWIASEENPLTARVMVNRIWEKMIGRGLVTSTENFGVTGQAPSHPQLLDYLAVRFVQSGWSVKDLIREIAQSRVYRITASFNERAHEYDPDNALLWRANPRRLDAEAIRDAMLLVSGEIDFARPRGSEVAKAGYVRVRDGILGDPREKAREALESMMADRMRQARNAAQSRADQFRGDGGRSRFGGRFGGNSGRPFQQAQQNRRPQDFQRRRFGGFRPGNAPQPMAQPADVYARVTSALDMNDAKFRSVYLPIVRDEVPRSLEVFDFPDAATVTGKRETSSTANQALYLMNNSFVLSQSNAFAKRLQSESPKVSDQLSSAFILAYGRPPTSGERSATARFIRDFGGARGDMLTTFCQSLFASAEFRYID